MRGLEPDMIAYNATIIAYEKEHQHEHALELLRALELLAKSQVRGLKLKVITFCATISACEKGQ